jgi:hypothetical protein
MRSVEASQDVDEVARAERLTALALQPLIVESSFCAGTSPSHVSGG